MELIYIISIIISVLAGVDMSIAQGLASNKQSAIYKEAQRVLNQINSNKAKANALYRAAINQQESLLREMVNAHPVSSRTKAVMKQYAREASKISNQAAIIDRLDKEAQDVSNKTQAELAKSQGSGSFVGDMINAGLNKSKAYQDAKKMHTDNMMNIKYGTSSN